MQAHVILSNLRKDAGYSQADAAAHLTDRSYPITHRAISKWERGDTQPNMEQFLLLLELYGVRDVLASFGLSQGERLNERGRAKLREYAGLLALDERFRANVAAHKTSRVLPLYDLPVSAGTGQFLDSEHYEMFDAGAAAPERADVAVRVRGESMLPRIPRWTGGFR